MSRRVCGEVSRRSGGGSERRQRQQSKLRWRGIARLPHLVRLLLHRAVWMRGGLQGVDVRVFDGRQFLGLLE